MCLERRAPGRLHAQLRIQALAGQALEREGRGAGKREGSAASGLSSRFIEGGLPSVMVFGFVTVVVDCETFCF